MSESVKPALDRTAQAIPGNNQAPIEINQKVGSEIQIGADAVSLAPGMITKGSIIAGHYQVLSLLGSGGMGVVLEAKDLALNRVVAIKLLQRHDQNALSRFNTEARAIGSLNHPNIVRVHQMGLTDHGQPFLVMDLVHGRTLANLIDTKHGLLLSEAVPILAQVCDALEHAHAKGIIHRDLKATNVMLSTLQDGSTIAQLVDFGIAKIVDNDVPEALIKQTATGDLIGSPAYMSPEQISKHDLDGRCDIYSLGCLIVEILTGSPPFPCANYLETLYQHLNASPPSVQNIERADLRDGVEIDAVILKCMAKEPKDRFQSTAEVKNALQSLLKQKDDLSWQSNCFQNIRLIVLRARAAKLQISNWMLTTAVMALLVVGAAGAYYFGMLNEPAERQWKSLWLQGQNEFDKGHFAKARENFKQSLLFAQSSLPLHKLIAPSLTELADISVVTGDWRNYRSFKSQRNAIYDAQKNDAKALRTQIEQALIPQRQLSAAESIDLCTRSNDLATVCVAGGNALGAKQLLQPTLKLAENHLPSTAEVYARSLHNLALICNNLGENEIAEHLYLKAIDSQRLSQSTRLNPDIGKDYIGIGRLRFQQNRYPEASHYFHEALRLYNSIFGPQSEQVAWVKVNMAEAFMAQGKKDLALEQLTQARALFDPLEHPDEQKRARCFALLAFVTGKTEDLKTALELQQASLRREPYYLASLLAKLGTRDLGNRRASDDAIGYCTRAFVIAEDNQPPLRQIETETLKKLETFYMGKNDILPLEPLYQFKLERDREDNPGSSSIVAQDLLDVGRFYMRVPDSGAAEKNLLAARDEQQNLSPNKQNEWRMADICGSLGQLYLDRSQPQKGEAYFVKMCQVLQAQKSSAEAPVTLGGSLLRYCSYLEGKGKTAEAGQLRLQWSRIASHIHKD